MKSSFVLRDFSLSTTLNFNQKEILLIVRDSSELPPPFDNDVLISSLDASMSSDTKYLAVEWMFAGVDKLGILRVNPNTPSLIRLLRRLELLSYRQACMFEPL